MAIARDHWGAAAATLGTLIAFASGIFSRSPAPALPPTNQIGGAATDVPPPTLIATADTAPTLIATADTAPTVLAQPATPQQTNLPSPSPSAIAAPTSVIIPEADSIEPQQIFTGTLPLTMTVRGAGLDQVQAAQLVADGRLPISLTLLARSADLLTLRIDMPTDPLNGAAHYRMELDGAVQESPDIILRDFIDQTTIRGVEGQYSYTGRVAVDGTGAYTRMRAAPDAVSQPIGLLRNGDQLDILREDIPDWYLARHNDASGIVQIGWLERWLVHGQGAPLAPSPTPTPAPLAFVGSNIKTATDAAVQCGASLFESVIYGTVKNSAGKPISRAVIRVTSVDGRNVFSTTTDRNGAYKVTNLGCTHWRVRLISVPNARGGIRANIVTVTNLNGGQFTSAEVRFRMQR